MSSKFALVKRYYNMKVWDINRVRAAVEKEWITEEEFQIITGQPYND